MSDNPPVHITKPHFFIIESLRLEDEDEERFEGRFIYNYLKMLGKEPIYYYIRSKRELEKISEIFRSSGYRYLYLSCHGSIDSLYSTFDKISFSDFSEIFNTKLNNRRVFISGCSLGRKEFAESLYSTNGGMYTVTAPLEEVEFRQMLPFWSSFFYLMESFSSNGMKSNFIYACLRLCANVFDVNIIHFFKSPRNEIKSKEFKSSGAFSMDDLNRILNLKNLSDPDSVT